MQHMLTMFVAYCIAYEIKCVIPIGSELIHLSAILFKKQGIKSKKILKPLEKDGKMCYTINTSGDEFVRMRIRCSEHPVRACEVCGLHKPRRFFVSFRELQNIIWY